ncbi:nucleoside phosphorylase [Candidatus Pacearchaeota archaeon]|nr:nucleoside phosphorylase [Candidatus Pacearchaeota archaeon]
MVYPNFKDKHLQESLFHPTDYIKYKKFKGKFPRKYIITYGERMKNYFLRKYKLKKIKLYSLLTIYVYKDIGIVRMTGIGAPNAATVLEELIALGGKEFINIGTAGGLDTEGVFLCTKALRDEGTSYHYLPHGDYTYPDQKLTKKLKNVLRKEKVPFLEGVTWTIDAPYRETRAEVEQYSKQGVATVEMEASALFAVAQYRKVKIASAFIVSDLLGKKWLPKFHRFDVRKAQHKLFDLVLKCLKTKP